MAKVSVIIPARNERHLQKTIDGVLAAAVGDLEILVCLDGYWPDPPLTDDPRVRILRFPERVRRDGKREGIGMRPCENKAAAVAKGEFLMKLDAHCILAPGFDASLKEACGPGDLVVPTRHSIDPQTWTMKRRDFNYHYLTFPYALSMYGYGLHAKTFDWTENRRINTLYAERPVDDLMSFQGSCWFQRKKDFDRLGPLDHDNFYFYQESQEVGLRTWLTGGRCLIDKRTWYAHLHKGREEGRGFFLSLDRKRDSERYSTDFFLQNRLPGATRTFAWLIEHFWPLLQEAPAADRWPADWQDPKYRHAFEARTPDQIPAHT